MLEEAHHVWARGTVLAFYFCIRNYQNSSLKQCPFIMVSLYQESGHRLFSVRILWRLKSRYQQSSSCLKLRRIIQAHTCDRTQFFGVVVLKFLFLWSPRATLKLLDIPCVIHLLASSSLQLAMRFPSHLTPKVLIESLSSGNTWSPLRITS